MLAGKNGPGTKNLNLIWCCQQVIKCRIKPNILNMKKDQQLAIYLFIILENGIKWTIVSFSVTVLF